MNNQAVVWALNGTEQYGGECSHVIEQCRKNLNSPDWEVKVIHCYSEGNRAADWLAN